MNRYTVVDGLPFLVSGGRAYRVRFDDAGLTVGAEAKLASVPPARYSDREIKAKCVNLNSIGKPETEEQPKPKGRTKKGGGGK